MRGRGKIVPRTALAATLALAPAVVPPAQAQSPNNWSLPTPEASRSGSAAQGPVDTQNPVVRPTGPEETPSPAPSPPPSAPPAPPAPVPTIDAPPPPPITRETPRAAPSSSVRTAPAESPAGAPGSPVPAISAAPSQAPAASEAPAAAQASAPVANKGWPLWWWALPAVLLTLAAAWLVARRRRPVAEEPWEEEPLEAPPEPVTRTPDAADPAPAPVRTPAPAFATAPAGAQEPARASGLLEFQPIAMRLSLVYATLQYRLLLTSQTDIPEGRLLGDMISAHGSLPQAAQLEPPPEALPLLQTITPMAAGQVLDLKGELRLPLTAVRPVRQGDAAFMVPLVRLALLGNERATPHLELGCVFTIGVPGSGPALAPLRLDTGPRDFTTLSAREIEAARRTVLLPLDPARAAG